MKQGKMSYDKDPKTTLAEKVRHAFEYYQAKYKTAPDICFVNQAMLDGTQNDAPIWVRTKKYLTVGNIWIGLDDNRKVKK